MGGGEMKKTTRTRNQFEEEKQWKLFGYFAVLFGYAKSKFNLTFDAQIERPLMGRITLSASIAQGTISTGFAWTVLPKNLIHKKKFLLYSIIELFGGGQWIVNARGDNYACDTLPLPHQTPATWCHNVDDDTSSLVAGFALEIVQTIVNGILSTRAEANFFILRARHAPYCDTYSPMCTRKCQ